MSTLGLALMAFIFIGALVVVMQSAVVISKAWMAAEQRWAAERKDLIDRLMAKDLTEVKQAQVIEARLEGARATSMARNEKRISEEAQKMAEGLMQKVKSF